MQNHLKNTEHYIKMKTFSWILAIPVIAYSVFEIYNITCEVQHLEVQFQNDLFFIKKKYLLGNLWGRAKPVTSPQSMLLEMVQIGFLLITGSFIKIIYFLFNQLPKMLFYLVFPHKRCFLFC